MTDTVQEQVFEIIAKQARTEVTNIRPDSTLKDLGIASLEAIELLFDIEEHFNIVFPDQDGTRFDTDTAQCLVNAVRKAREADTASDEKTA